MAAYDVIGNIAIVKFSRDTRASEKKKWAQRFLKEHKAVQTVLEKAGKFSGRLRTLKTRYIAGEKTKEALYKENGCVFRLNVDSCYFSPRLSTERVEIASFVKPRERVLVMFGGVAPFAIVIGRLSRALEIVSVELGRECSKYALENVKRNKLRDRVRVVGGDVRRVIGISRRLAAQTSTSNCINLPAHPKIVKSKLSPAQAHPISARFASKFDSKPASKIVDGLFDRIVMARPNLKDSFLDVAFSVIRRGGMIHYYGFCKEEEVGGLKALIEEEARGAGRKVKILRIKRAGEIGVRRWRWRVDLKIEG